MDPSTTEPCERVFLQSCGATRPQMDPSTTEPCERVFLQRVEPLVLRWIPAPRSLVRECFYRAWSLSSSDGSQHHGALGESVSAERGATRPQMDPSTTEPCERVFLQSVEPLVLRWIPAPRSLVRECFCRAWSLSSSDGSQHHGALTLSGHRDERSLTEGRQSDPTLRVRRKSCRETRSQAGPSHEEELQGDQEPSGTLS
ncbi:hypothetical protein JOQ06_005195 [Pogonophryne albipinna]|uniref:Uncharacterized protein n=1 Tax=Pogonophryne albipinna TaxID=1090488 RepID=A0AAD6A662_9TELE|nr:hypothetical protein JOQ06_005195 [Pogonophryne albipinna]